MRGIIWHRMLESRRVAASVMVVLVCVLLAMICNADEPAKRMPVPDAAARQAAVKTVRDIYKNDLAKAITSEQFAAVATELIKTAGETKGDPAGQFALLQVATEVATQAGNAKAAMAAVDAVVELFEVEELTAKSKTFANLIQKVPAGEQAGLLPLANSLIELALAADQFDSAKLLNEQAQGIARKGSNADVKKELIAQATEIRRLEKAYESVAESIKKLAASPTNQEANLIVGKYRCFDKGDWERGLQALVLSSDPKLQDLARKELAKPDGAAEQLDIADSWWTLAAAEKPPVKNRLQRHAAEWYEPHASDVTGLTKVRVTARLAEVAKAGPAKEVAKPAKAVSSSNKVLNAGDQRDDNSLKMKFVYCPPGTFKMGSPVEERARRADEDQVDVTITKGFWLGRYSVTQAEFKLVSGTTPWVGKSGAQEDANCPATYVTWDDAVEFTKRLTAAELKARRLPKGYVYALPTEAQREYACRAGSTTAYYYGDDASELGKYAWFVPNTETVGEKYAHQVGKLKPNPWGLFDMHGNIQEWCRDGFQPKLPGGTDPLEETGTDRVRKGGGWNDAAARCRSAARSGSPILTRFASTGFRVALVPAN